MSRPEMEFSKARLEMLCDGIFAIAMTLLVLELRFRICRGVRSPRRSGMPSASTSPAT